MKKLLLWCLLAGAFFFIQMQPVGAADAFSLYLLSLAEMKSDFGNPVDTYEDVDPITNIRPTFSGFGPVIWNSTLMSTYGGAIKQSTGQDLIDKIGSTNGMIFSGPHVDFVGFLLSGYFYLDSGEFDKFGVWHEYVQSMFPYDYDKTQKPHEKRYFLCLKGGFEYITPPTIPPNAKSCDHNRDWCSYPPCVKEEKEVGDEDGDGIFDEVIVAEDHSCGTKNIYYKLGQAIKDGFLTTSTGAAQNESDIKFNMTFKDRTPPIIEGCVGDDFPELGKIDPATTGDWYKVDGLKIKDNVTEKIATCLALGKIDVSPPLVWKSEENWVIESPRIMDSGDETDQIILPNSCHGVMRYSVFAWDENGLVNPGEPLIEEDKPEICYGLREPPGGVADLKKVPDLALPWPLPPLDFSKSLDISYVNSNINPGDRRGEGLLHIRDNDLPNLVVRIESVKDMSRVFFPPILPPGAMTIIPSTEYKKPLALPNANGADYQDFLGPVPSIPYNTELLQDPLKPLYFRIFDLVPSPVMKPSDADLLNKFKDPLEHVFTRKHFRLEDYNQSDTLAADGQPDLNPDNFGQRCGFGESIVALLDLPGNVGIQEDVEYLIDIWADDNVKWATIDSTDAVLENIVAVPTGIVSGELIVDVPNQYPPARQQVLIDQSESVSKRLRVVFREPTPPVGIKNEGDLIAHKFPFIEAKVTDYSGLTRKIKLYLRVSNENPEIRVIDRKHEKRD